MIKEQPRNPETDRGVDLGLTAPEQAKLYNEMLERVREIAQGVEDRVRKAMDADGEGAPSTPFAGPN